MDIRKLQRAIVDGLEDVKAQHVAVFNTEALSPLFERVIVASGTSNRQTKALAASVRDKVRAAGFTVLATEGEGSGEWVIVDCGAAVAHIMQPAIRDYYRLEEIWGVKPVRMKAGVADGGPAHAGATRPAAKKSAPKKAAPRKAAGAKAAPAQRGTGKAPARKTPHAAVPASKKAAPRKAAPRKTAH